MKNKIFTTFMAAGAAAFLLPASVNAQDEVTVGESAVSVSEFSCDNVNRYYSSWRDNWFIQLGAGVNQPFVETGVGAESNRKTIDKHLMTVEYNFGVGRWISPYVGLRLNALGGVLHWDNPTAAEPHNGWTRANHVNVNLELMWDMCNSMAGINPNRPVSVIPFVGLGGDYTWRIQDRAKTAAAGTNIEGLDGKLRTNSWTLPVSAGVQFRFRLCKYIDFFAEARAAFYGDNWNGCSYGRSIESNVSALGGFNINFGGRKWGSYNECATAAEIAALNGEVNNLRAELLEANQALAASIAQNNTNAVAEVVQVDCPDQPLLSTVRFKINSSVIAPEEEVNVYNMAQYLKDNPDQTITIVGYADKDTGTADYNQALSLRRAQAVADQIIKKYGINANRITVKADGSSVQPYPANNDWNRIVIFSNN